ncbi:MAG: ABC transporter substrate-binding protein [Gammaproteobacteria bacterium]|nr:ABC transporter substrate-binding protein [Gammaproteobacteria bacterium]MCW8909520.1 ABC transporter substrate-binding protein [Gammaproteobacteria bacterium]MCW9004397.1 ABC transporter substrate-binding protein [Gammaproteobacteria bacterium]MCW9055814.1 ABC transporter substrate-binding protein [Gammaproteobacteria bacterium]
MKKIISLVMFMLLLAVNASAEPLGPQELIKQTSDNVLHTLEKNKALYEKDPDQIYTLVNEIILPHLDFKAMSQLALGKHWRNANDEQKEQFTAVFKTMLIRTYSKSLTEYTGQEVEYLPFRPQEDKKIVTVKTKIKQDSGPAIPIDYRLRFKNDIWKVFDIKIDGISLVTNYRNSFAADIREVGISGLIERMNDKYRKKTT